MQTAGLAGGAASPGAATLQSAALIFRKATPHTSILSVILGPLQAGLHHGATLAYRFRLIDLHQSGTGITDREEQFGKTPHCSSASIIPAPLRCRWLRRRGNANTSACRGRCTSGAERR